MNGKRVGSDALMFHYQLPENRWAIWRYHMVVHDANVITWIQKVYPIGMHTVFDRTDTGSLFNLISMAISMDLVEHGRPIFPSGVTAWISDIQKMEVWPDTVVLEGRSTPHLPGGERHFWLHRCRARLASIERRLRANPNARLRRPALDYPLVVLSKDSEILAFASWSELCRKLETYDINNDYYECFDRNGRVVKLWVERSTIYALACNPPIPEVLAARVRTAHHEAGGTTILRAGHRNR